MADTIYWINSSDNTILSAPLDGSGGVATLYDSMQGVSSPGEVALDPGAGRIYWSNGGDHTIQRAPLDGSGPVAPLYDSTQGVSGPFGVALDPGAGRIYWSESESANGIVGKIRRAPLDGSGPVVTLYPAAQGVFYPNGLAIDPAAGRIYWGDVDKICGAPLAVGGQVDILYDEAHGAVSAARGVAIDPTPPGPAPMISAGSKRFTVSDWLSMAAERINSLVYSRSQAGRIYWGNWDYQAAVAGLVEAGTIRGAPLAGFFRGGTANTLYDRARGVTIPGGVAIDPNPAGPAPERFEVDDVERFAIGGWLRDLFSRPSGSPGRVYWSNGPSITRPGEQPNPNDNTIRSAPLDGSGPVVPLYDSTQGVSSPTALALLRAPVGTGAPTIVWSLILDGGPFGDLGFGHAGPLDQRLSCTRGTWAADLPGSRLYRAPQSFAYQWRLNGTDIGGATAADYTPSAPGSYTCRVTATNQAGSAAQTSAPFTVS